MSSDSNEGNDRMVDAVDEKAQDQERGGACSRFLAPPTHTNYPPANTAVACQTLCIGFSYAMATTADDYATTALPAATLPAWS